MSTALRSSEILQRRPTLRENFGWALTGRVVFAACQWGNLAALAKLGTSEMVGQYALGMAVSMPVILFLRFKLRIVLATETGDGATFIRCVRLTIINTIIALLVIGTIGLLFEHESVFFIIALTALFLACESFSELAYGLFQQQECMDRITKSLVTRGTLTLAALSITLYITQDLVVAVAAMLAAAAIVLVGYDMALVRLTRREARQGSMEQGLYREVFSFGLSEIRSLAPLLLAVLPLGIGVLVGSLGSSVPRYFLHGLHGAPELGVFAAIAGLMAPGNVIARSLSEATIARLARDFAAGDVAGFRRLIFKLLGIVTLVGACGLAVAFSAGDFILTMLYTPEYAGHPWALMILMTAAAMGLIGAVFGTAVFAMRKYWIPLPTNVFSLLVIFTVSFFCVDSLGLTGAAVAVLTGNLARAFILGGVAASTSRANTANFARRVLVDRNVHRTVNDGTKPM